jgi:hypothetical protein
LNALALSRGRLEAKNQRARCQKATPAIVKDGGQKNRNDQQKEFELTCRNSGNETEQEEYRYEDNGDAISDRAGLSRRWQKFQ